MIELITDNPIFGIVLTSLIYILSLQLYKKTKLPLLNPVLLSMVIIILLLYLFHIPVDNYFAGADYISLLLPFTIIFLALPLYRQLPLLKKHKIPIIAGICSGVITSFVSIVLLSRLFGLDKSLIISIVPKSITTPLGLIVSESIGGIRGITVISIVFTGLSGIVIYGLLFKILKITEPVAKGIALGTSSHAIGTSKALELGETDGAMSSLAIIITGIITVLAAPLFIFILKFV